MLAFITKILIKEIIEAVIKAVSDYFELKKKKKENLETYKEVVREKDPKVRAERMRDFLNNRL